MKENAVICAIEYALKDERCNEIPVAMLFDRVKRAAISISACRTS
jgi:hypothetical protein